MSNSRSFFPALSPSWNSRKLSRRDQGRIPFSRRSFGHTPALDQIGCSLGAQRHQWRLITTAHLPLRNAIDVAKDQNRHRGKCGKHMEKK